MDGMLSSSIQHNGCLMSIRGNLGRIADCNQFFIYRLSEWNGAKWTRKQPWGNGHVVSPSDPANWSSFDVASARCESLAATGGDVAWAVGLWLTANLNVFFLDIDRLAADYTLDDEATSMLQRFPGCMVEWSSSRRGLHVIGTHSGGIRHAKRHGRMELYTADRGIALGTAANGSIDTNAHAALAQLVNEQFQPPAAITVTPPATTGEPDMGALALALRQCDKIATAPEGERNYTLNTAAYTLGGMVGAGRISREDARAALIAAVQRAGWGNLPLQISKIDQALGSGVETPIAKPTLPEPVAVSLSMNGLIAQFMEQVNSSGTYTELMDGVVPKIIEAAIPHNMIGGLANCINARLDFFNMRMPIAELRALLSPRRAASVPEAPLWVQKHCYVKRLDKFFDVTTGVEVTSKAFDAQYNRMMPERGNGKRESASEWATDRWNICVVDDVEYRPDQPTYFTYESVEYVNRFSPDSMAPPTAASPNAAAAIEAFNNHLFALAGHRQEVYSALLQWLAHNVQRPGHKIRWSPLVKGIQGDGKSMIGDLMFAVMGSRNVKMTSNATLANSGGFTDWATGAAVNFIEEIRLSGKQKHELFNAMKIFISDTRIEINRKGRASSGAMTNYTNHWANTNFNDALPIEPKGNRRWMVVFSPYSDIMDAVRSKGLHTISDLVEHFKWMGESMRGEPGAWRAWLLSVDLSNFSPDSRAPETAETGIMARASEDDIEQVVTDIIEQGGIGVHREAFSATRLGKLVELELGYVPRGKAWNAILSKLGYLQFGPMSLDGKIHRIWTKKQMTTDEIRQILSKTSVGGLQMGNNPNS